MIATERGKVLYNALLEPLLQLEKVEEQFKRSTEKNTPTITLGMCFESFQFILEKHLHQFDFNLVTRFSDYKTLLLELEKGIVDIVATPQKSETKGIEHIIFGEEKIVLIGSKDIKTETFDSLLESNNKKDLKEWLLQHKWYGVSGDNEHFKRFWRSNFNKNPDFRQNYIVPNFNSIIRSLTYGSGLAIAPDFLCKRAMSKGDIQILWEGNTPIINSLYFAYRKNSIFQEPIDELLELFKGSFKSDNEVPDIN